MLLFVVFANVIVPYFLDRMQVYDAAAGVTSNNLFFGIGALLLYFIEPVVHYSSATSRISIPHSNDEKAESIGSFLLGLSTLLVGLPYGVLVALRPVIRAGILYTSFRLLHLGNGESPLFVVIVMSDMFLYYAHLLWPNWVGGPAKRIAGLSFLKRPGVFLAGRILSIFYTALLCTTFTFLAYSSIAHEKQDEALVIMLFSWFLLTLYVRMDYLEHNMDNLWKSIAAMPLRDKLVGLAALSFSFVGFMWQFWFGWL